MEVTLLWVLLGANLFDVVATHVALAHGVSEANPFVLAILDTFGIAGVALAKLACMGVFATTLRCGNAPPWFRIHLMFITAVYCLLAIYHMYHWVTD